MSRRSTLLLDSLQSPRFELKVRKMHPRSTHTVVASSRQPCSVMCLC